MQYSDSRAVRFELSRFDTVPMRTFHLTWLAFFVCFFAWFGIAPLMPVVREQLGLTREQIGNTVIASVAFTALARMAIGWVCDSVGPRRTYAALLWVGSIPVMTIGLCDSYESFLIARLCIGMVGASFVITQYHTSVMFAPNVVGTASATAAGWGNLGGGVTQLTMPLLASALLHLGLNETLGWRVAMIVPGLLMIAMGVVYYRYTRDTPDGDLRELRAAGALPAGGDAGGSTLLTAARDARVWALAFMYGACFGVDLTIHNVAALYFHDRFGLSVTSAGMLAALHGLMNVFARSLGGMFGDRIGMRFGLSGRAGLVCLLLLVEGLSLVMFSRADALVPAIALLAMFSLFVEMCSGATYSVVPLLNRRAIGSVSGIVGAGGNIGAVLAGFLIRADGLSMSNALMYLGIAVIAVSSTALLVSFSSDGAGHDDPGPVSPPVAMPRIGTAID
jgi:NNP family nitrate/nitrite transporter-like MFS transporter